MVWRKRRVAGRCRPTKAQFSGPDQADINNTLSAAWGIYVNDFVDRGRVKRVYIRWRRPGTTPVVTHPPGLSVATATTWRPSTASRGFAGPADQMLQRFNGLSAVQFQGGAVSGVSSGMAMAEMSEMASSLNGFDLQWSGLSRQERSSSVQRCMGLFGIASLYVSVPRCLI